MDSYQTTQVFSRQEEIDLVVFVVSAENHFTLSAKEFIWNAAHEKSLVFIVVNRFDNIRDKNRCRKMILDQVADLSPETHKDASDFIHFVSSSEIVKGLPDDDGDDPDDGPGDDDRPHPDFDQLEASLRDFVLEKRSLSKLAPAKTYLKNILKDLEMLSQVNISVAETEKEKILKDLDDLAPEFEKSVKQSLKVSEQSDQIIEEVSQKAYDFTKDHLCFQNKIEYQARKKEEYAKTAKEVSTNLKYFKRLHKDVVDQHALVDRCHLDTSLAVD
ncbi:hypothetical protein D0Z03_000358 [Geotrichum reessii]|nr:hypothetical protein D0Z03_000358 [Galactomyces reessii]